MLAFALRADGWYLRSDIVWARPNPMPESVTDRPTKSHSYVFLLGEAAPVFLRPGSRQRTPDRRVFRNGSATAGPGASGVTNAKASRAKPAGCHRRTARTWRRAAMSGRCGHDRHPALDPEAHFATLPRRTRADRCILAGGSGDQGLRECAHVAGPKGNGHGVPLRRARRRPDQLPVLSSTRS